MAAVFCKRRMGPVHGWRVGLLSGSGLYVGFSISVGMDTVSLRFMAFCVHLSDGAGNRVVMREWVWVWLRVPNFYQCAD